MPLSHQHNPMDVVRLDLGNPMDVVRVDLGRDRAPESGPSPGTGVSHCSVANLKSQACANSALMSVYTLESFITPELRRPSF